MSVQMSADDVAVVFPEVLEITDAGLREDVIGIWQEIAAEMAWSSLHEIPASVRQESFRPLVLHIRAVTRMALALSEIAKEINNRTYDRDLLVAACLLHDASKPVETEPDDVRPCRRARKSLLGSRLQHGVYVAHKALARGMSLDLAQLLITHTHQSNTRGTTWEAAALFYADFADTDAALSAEGATLHIERWKS